MEKKLADVDFTAVTVEAIRKYSAPEALAFLKDLATAIGIEVFEIDDTPTAESPAPDTEAPARRKMVRFTPEVDAKIEAFHAAGKSPGQIAFIVKRPTAAVAARIKKLGLPDQAGAARHG